MVVTEGGYPPEPSIKEIEWTIKDLKRWGDLFETLYDIKKEREIDFQLNWYENILDFLHKKKKLPEKILRRLEKESEFCQKCRDEVLKGGI